MCESTAYVVEDDKETIFLKDVIKITPVSANKFLVENLLGDQKEFSGRVREIDFMAHKIFLAKD